MILDVVSVVAMTALVVTVCGTLFIVETLLRRDEGAGRVWAIAFLAAMLTTFSYVVWIQIPGAWWAIAAGNGAFVAGTGCMWLGCRRFNARRVDWAAPLVVVAAAAAAAAVVVAGPDGGDWAGALWMFGALIVFAGAGAVECLRGALRASRTAWMLGGVLGFQSAFYVVRTVAFASVGPDSELFRTAFGTVTTSVFTVTLTIVAVVVTSVLRSGRAPVRGSSRVASSGVSDRGILPQASLEDALAGLCRRAEQRSEIVAVVSVRVDDLEQISTAFGGEVTRAVRETWRRGVRRHAPTDALVGEDGPLGLVIAMLVDSDRDARRDAAVVYRGLFGDLSAVVGGIIPVVGIGVALSDVSGYDATGLVDVARDAAVKAAASVEASVLVAEAD